MTISKRDQLEEAFATSLCEMLARIASWSIDAPVPVTLFVVGRAAEVTVKDALALCTESQRSSAVVEIVDPGIWQCPSEEDAAGVIQSTCAFIGALHHSPYGDTLWLNTSSASCTPLAGSLIQGAERGSSGSDHAILRGHAIASAPLTRIDLMGLDYFFARSSSKSVLQWLQSFKDIYLRHAMREAFPLVDPYFAFEVARMEHREVVLHPLERFKECPDCPLASCACPHCEGAERDVRTLLRRLDRDVRSVLQAGRRLPSLRLSASMVDTVLSSVWRLCPVKRGCRDNWPDSRFKPFQEHLAAKEQFLSRKYKVVIVTGSSVEMLGNTNTRLMLANKQAYAEAHGYGFEIGLSNLVVAKERLMPTVSSHQKFRGEFVKTLMVFAAMRRNPDADWFLLADHDVWFNPLAMRDTSLDMFLDAIPENKHFAHANYHSMNTGIVFIRQSQAARELVMKWWAIGSSGLIQCHSWDQAAAQLLLLHQLDGELSAAPFNFTCQMPNCGNNQRKQYWSCDKGFTDALIAAFGNDTAARDYQKGLLRPGPAATGHPRTDFHVLTESPLRPRLQCMDCRNISRLTLKGANYPVNYRGVDGWFTSHKGINLFRDLFQARKSQQPHTTIEMGQLEFFDAGLSLLKDKYHKGGGEGGGRGGLPWAAN